MPSFRSATRLGTETPCVGAPTTVAGAGPPPQKDLVPLIAAFVELLAEQPVLRDSFCVI